MKKNFKSAVSMVLMLAMMFTMILGSGSLAFAKTENGTAAQSLTVNIKYTDETVSKTYSSADLTKLGLKTARYSYIDSLPSVVIAEAKGVYITDILDDMGVKKSESDLKKIDFTSTDGGSKSIKYSGLFGFYYPDLAKAGYEFADDKFVSADQKAVLAGGETAEAMLAVECDWRRVASGSTFENPGMTTPADSGSIVFRYMPVADDSVFGAAKSTAAGSMKWIETMDVTVDAALNSKDDNPDTPVDPVKIPDISTVKGTLSDIAGHWAENDIYRMVALGAVNGNPDGTFKANDSVTRAEFVTMLMKALVKTEQGVLEGSNKFADAKGHWAENFIGAAVDAGIVKGTSATTFEPNAKITRQEMAVMIVNALKFENKAGSVSGADTGKIASWASAAVDICNDHGLMTYDGKNKFYPLNNATRAEAATVLWRAFSAKGYVTE
ncbi:MAG: S-layer homology domain-containing protein [Bacillota bacterium]|jgi:hypothetical protein